MREGPKGFLAGPDTRVGAVRIRAGEPWMLGGNLGAQVSF